MKKERNTHKYLNDLYTYIDSDDIYLDDKYTGYYGLFYNKKKEVMIDPKRFKKFLSLSDEAYKIMSKRNTTFYHPTKKNYNDYYVNQIIDVIIDLKNNFNKRYSLIIKKALKTIKEPKIVTPGDNYNFQCGISGIEAASSWAIMTNNFNKINYESERAFLVNGLYSQYILDMTSKIEAITIKMYYSINKTTKRWNRSLLYDNINSKKISPRTLPAFHWHDKLYSLWNFLKHNNMDVYDSLKKAYPEILIDKEYEDGDFGTFYVKLNEKVINMLLDGVMEFFKQWCELNLDENYERAQWDYDAYFEDQVNKEIDSINNPLGLSIFDELD